MECDRSSRALINARLSPVGLVADFCLFVSQVSRLSTQYLSSKELHLICFLPSSSNFCESLEFEGIDDKLNDIDDDEDDDDAFAGALIKSGVMPFILGSFWPLRLTI